MAGGRFAGGNGTQASPFLIEDAHDLNAMRNYTNGFYFELIKDINLNTPPYNEGEGWEPISFWNSFLDGRGHRIIGLTVKSTGKDVGFVLKTGFVTPGALGTPFFSNILFEDFYLEINDQNSGNLVFTLLGINHEGGTGPYNILLGCSVKGTINYNAPNRTNAAGLLTYSIGTWSPSYYYTTIHLQNVFIDIKNIGTARYDVFKTSGGLTLTNVLLKSSGLLGDWRSSGAPGFGLVNSYRIDDVNTDYSLYTSMIANKVDNAFISNPSNLPTFANAVINNKQVWHFPGNTPVEIQSPIQNSFLVEADDQIFSLNSNNELISIAPAPVNPGMFESFGVSHIESIPVESWRWLRQNFSEIKIHSQLHQPSGKNKNSSLLALSFDRLINDKTVLKTSLNFNVFNNNVSKISIREEE